MKKEKKFFITVLITLIFMFFLLGIQVGIQVQTANVIKMAGAVQIEEMNIDLNETQITELMTEWAEEYADEYKKEQEEKET